MTAPVPVADDNRAAASNLRLAIGAALVAFGTAFPAVKVALRAFTPGPLALARFLIAGIALAIWLAATRMPRDLLSEWKRIVFLAAANVVAYHLLFNRGQASVSPSAASVLVNTSPIWTAGIAVAMAGETARPRLWLGMLVAFIGAGIIAVSERGALRFSAGALLVLSAAFLQGLSFIVQRPAVARLGATAVTAASIWIGCLILAPFFAADAMAQLQAAHPLEIAAVVWTGVVSSVFGLVCWAYVLNRVPATTASPFLMLVPVVATIVSLVLLADVPRPATVAGGLITLAGISLGTLKRR